MHKIFITIFSILLISCTGGTSDPLGGGSGIGSGGVPTQVGLGGVGEGVSAPGGNPANAPEMDAGDVIPLGDPELLTLRVECSNAKCIKKNPNHPDYDPNEPIDESCVYFKGHIGAPILGEWIAGPNGRVVRFVDTYLDQVVDHLTNKIDNINGSFEASLTGDEYHTLRAFLAPEGFVPSGTEEVWAACGPDCIPENPCTGLCPQDEWQEFLNPFDPQSCGFMDLMKPPDLKLDKAKKHILTYQ